MRDVGGYAVEAVLAQQDEREKDYAIVYASKGLKKHKKNYASIEKKALTIDFAVKKLDTTYGKGKWGRRKTDKKQPSTIVVKTENQPANYYDGLLGRGERKYRRRRIRWILV